jgi:hypothetical protein
MNISTACSRPGCLPSRGQSATPLASRAPRRLDVVTASLLSVVSSGSSNVVLDPVGAGRTHVPPSAGSSRFGAAHSRAALTLLVIT